MRRLLRPVWWPGLQHPADEVLIQYMDGETSARQSRRIAAHLDTCWSCRARRERFEHAIGAFVSCRPPCDQPVVPPHGWAGFEARVAAERPADLHFPETLSGWRLGLLPSFRYASALTLVLALAAWVYFGSSALSATEVLRRSELAEARRIGQIIRPVAYQKLRLERRSGRGVNADATVEIWRDHGGSRFKRIGGNGLWQDLDRVMRLNSLDSREPLSPAVYGSMCGRGVTVRESTLPGGRAAFALEGERQVSHAPDSILQADLLIRAADWHPVHATLLVREQNEIAEYQIAELAYAVQPLELVERAVFGVPTPELTKPAFPVPPRLEPADVTSLPALDLGGPQWKADFDSVEIDAWYALHQARACLGESVEVVRTASGDVSVHGLVESAARRDQLLAALLPVTLAQVEIGTTDAMTEQLLAQASAVPPPGREGQPKPVLVLQKQLEKYFADRGGSEAVGNAITDLSNAAVNQAEAVLAEAWALRSLEQAWPREKVVRLKPRSLRMLEQMLRDHNSALRLRSRQCVALLTPFFSPLVDVDATMRQALPAKQEEPRIPEIFAAARQAEALITGLFAGMNEAPKTPAEPVARLLQALGTIQSTTGSLEAELARGLPSTFTAERAEPRRTK